MTTNGNAGITFNVTETTATTDTGTVTQAHTIATTVSALTIESTDKVASISGTVGTTAFDLNLNDVSNQSGTGYDVNVVRNQEVDYTTMKQITIHNTDDTNTITVGPGSSNSFLAASEQITLSPGQAISLTYSTAKSVSTTGNISIVADAASTTFKTYLLGT